MVVQKVRVFTAFSGYDSQCMALDRLKEQFAGFDYELVGWSEIDKYAIQAHNAIYPQWRDRNYGDIAKIDWHQVPDFDLFTYSFPCTDISSAGRQEGLKEGSGTRSSLLWECRRAIEIKRPRHLLMENVKALVSDKFRPFFLEWERYLRGLGYMNFSEVLNAKDFGVPQNRERIFMISTLDNEIYHFPKKIKLDKRLKDVLEKNVDEKYYLSEKMIANFSAHVERKQKDDEVMDNKTDKTICFNSKVNGKQPSLENRIYDVNGIATAITCGFHVNIMERDTEMKGNYEEPRICTMVGRDPENPSSRDKSERYEQMLELGDDVSNTLISVQKDNLVAEPLIIQQATKQGYVEVQPGSVFDASFPESKTRRGRLQDNGKVSPTLMANGEPPCFYEGKIEEPNVLTPKRPEFGKEVRKKYESGELKMSRHDMQEMQPKNDGISNTITSVQKDNYWVMPSYRIRKLTERECFRLMGVSEKNIDIIQTCGVSKTQQYKMAGNSIVVDVLFHIFRKLYVDKQCENQQLKMF